MRVNSVQPGPLIGAAKTASVAKPASVIGALPSDSVQISSTARQLSAAGDPVPATAPSLEQATSTLDDSFNQLEDRLMQKLQEVRSENEYEVQKLQHVVQSHLTQVDKAIQLPGVAKSPASATALSPTAPPPLQTSALPFNQLASALSQKVAAVENKIEQSVDKSTIALRLHLSPTPVAQPTPAPSPIANFGQSLRQQVDDLEKLLTANISQFTHHMDAKLTGLEHSFMDSIAAMQKQPGQATPRDPLNELLNR